jgi:O-antigen/teichoic acid export membrane protein
VLSGRVATGDEAGERHTYHLGAQSLAVLVVPAAAVMAFFAYDLVVAWTSSAETARQAAPVVRLLVIGTALNGLSNAPFLLQLAHGRTRLGIGIHLGLLLLFLPALVIATSRFGAIGAAAVWIGVNALDLLLSIPLTHRLMLRGEGWRWLFRDVLGPALIGILVVALGWLLVNQVDSPYLAVAGALLTLIAAWLAAAFSASQVRHWLLA